MSTSELWLPMPLSHPAHKVWKENADAIRETLNRLEVKWSMVYLGLVNGTVPGIRIHLQIDTTESGRSPCDKEAVEAELRRQLVPKNVFPVLGFLN